ncbi:MAG: peptide ABC transporter substrate-binding protein [candidate division Zixibacteria bacterium]|nr:peptide ABC transporter substrate-binding protein [candidate division Zixibacteria bacterium]
MPGWGFSRTAPLFLAWVVCFATCNGSAEKQNTTSAPAGPVVNSVGVELPSDAAPLSEQMLMTFIEEPKTLDISLDNYGVKGADPWLFERLVMFDPDDIAGPGVADRWEPSPDGRKWTFYLRKDAKWSDGRPLTAQDFVFTYRRFLDPAEGNVFAFLFYDIKNARAFNHGDIKDRTAVGVRAIDDRTLEIETEGPCPYLPYIVAYNSAAPVPPHQVEKYGRRWTEAGNMVSNYTYKLTEWVYNKYLLYDLNPHYNGPHKARLEKLKLKFIIERQHPGITPYENNEVDRQDGISATDLGMIEQHPTLSTELRSNPHFQTWYLFFRAAAPPFNDLRVRQAFSHAIDREMICRVVLKGHGTQAYTMLPPGFSGYTGDRLKDIQKFDIEKAKKLLADAGYPGGKGFPTVEFWLRQADPNQMSIAQAIQEMLKQNLGVQTQLRNQEVGLYMDNMYKHAVPFSLIPYQYDYPDPHNMLSQVWHSQPVGHGRHDWKNTRFDEMVDLGGTTIDQAKRMGYYAEAERALVEDVGGVFIYHTHALELRKPWVKGLNKNAFGSDMFWGNRTSLMGVYIGDNVGKRVK